MLALIIFIVEILIALFVRDRIIHPVGGDFLIVIFLYCLVRTFTSFKPLWTALSSLIFAYLIEMTQYYHGVRLLGLEDVKLARVIIGTNFSWSDIGAYTAGILFVLLLEIKFNLTLRWNTL